MNSRSEGGGNPRIADVGDVERTIHVESMNLGVERFVDGTGRAGEVNDAIGAIDGIHGEAVRFEPAGDGLDVVWRGPEALFDFGKREPLVVFGGRGIMEARDQRRDARLLRRGHLHL
jgi:hypothetical protein